ncbi:hypothetical protein BGZ60DRAFT_194604 [Tricladium varicosporioides]|nr:hypothetical protein BGZ60DRAFT_194604 [Hymenoscyphus varicosporioides]
MTKSNMAEITRFFILIGGGEGNPSGGGTTERLLRIVNCNGSRVEGICDPFVLEIIRMNSTRFCGVREALISTDGFKPSSPQPSSRLPSPQPEPGGFVLFHLMHSNLIRVDPSQISRLSMSSKAPSAISRSAVVPILEFRGLTSLRCWLDPLAWSSCCCNCHASSQFLLNCLRNLLSRLPPILSLWKSTEAMTRGNCSRSYFIKDLLLLLVVFNNSLYDWSITSSIQHCHPTVLDG